jgi:3-methyladenine DNA glycosylase/8-oxoguanine DNA glycosylase|tara:strand:+ start:494 stop:922 length:429 start_codon:yes stop_codon:yes gene_type:complete
MALSRAAAAAARKAAKNRGLQGNRGADGSLVRVDRNLDEYGTRIPDSFQYERDKFYIEMGEEKLKVRHSELEKEIHDLERNSLDYQENRGDPRRDIEDMSYLDDAMAAEADRIEELVDEISKIEDFFDRNNIDYRPLEHIEP